MNRISSRHFWLAGLLGGLCACGTAVGQSLTEAAPKTAPEAVAADKAQKAKGKKAGAEKKATAQRDSVITAERIEFDNKEGVILFDENVLVDDEQFVMRSDRLLVFMEGTNDVQQIMAVGNVLITNLNRTASCGKAVYTRKNGQIVMTEKPRLHSQGDRGGEVTGDRITFWLDDERLEVFPGRVVLPPGTFNKVESRQLIPGVDGK